MTYIIAEIGQNHNGNLDRAKKLIAVAAQEVYHEGVELKGCDAVKFTVRDLNHECSSEQWNAEYKSEHRYGITYGEHRKKLELSLEQITELHNFAWVRGIDFILTICNPGIVEKYIGMADKIKIASRDLTNIPLLKEISKYQASTVILSTGMCRDDGEIHLALKILKDKQVWLMHCISEYPTDYENCNMLSIRRMNVQFGNRVEKVGYSDHTSGILAPVVAVANGAQVIEKHITLNRNDKGTDHRGSLEPEGLRRCVRDIRNTELMLLPNDTKDQVAIRKTKEKIGRSLAVNKPMRSFEIIKDCDLIMVSPGTGFPYSDRFKFIGKPAGKNYNKNDILI